ncbi:MAG: glycoside hydrolase family 32 protein, partial [Bacteroidetes bacterium]
MSKRLIHTMLMVLIAGTMAQAQFYPHEDYIDYREDYRGQYHFSPRSGWMNDINGLVYQGGRYHMIYQWGDKIRHGGYATSPDLLHWKDEGVALIPQKSFLSPQAVRNVSGDQVFSGSAVAVSGRTALGITGSDREAIIAIYTGTSEGTCLAWSNDGGRSWHDFEHNPVAHATSGDYPRDPCVIWHDGTSRWILLLYENGTTFYGSDDLIHWDSLSNVDFGFECPDFYELPVDGDSNNRKWVLQDANGSYLVGTFDGTRFRKDPLQDTLVMTLGPDFYAGQTFPMGNLPRNDPRVIQIAWMDHWNGGIGEII